MICAHRDESCVKWHLILRHGFRSTYRGWDLCDTCNPKTNANVGKFFPSLIVYHFRAHVVDTNILSHIIALFFFADFTFSSFRIGMETHTRASHKCCRTCGHEFCAILSLSTCRYRNESPLWKLKTLYFRYNNDRASFRRNSITELYVGTVSLFLRNSTKLTFFFCTRVWKLASKTRGKVFRYKFYCRLHRLHSYEIFSGCVQKKGWYRT